jgi:UDP-2,4-diacetamido-2,4,6-trideoxy-beta-L-altropyranose hydrolase
VKVVIRADATPTIGIGHFTRCMTLARELQAADHSVEFQSHCEIPYLIKTAANNGIQIVRLNSENETKNSPLIQSDQQCDWAVLDGYHFDEAAQIAAQKSADKLLVIDDTPRDINYSADLILDQNYGAESQRYPAPTEKLLLGTDYALIRSEITSLRNHSLSRSRANITSITVTFGGSDPADATGKIIEALANNPTMTFQINVIAGPANSRIAQLAQQCDIAEFDLHVNPSNLPEILSNSDVAISATGTTVWELMCLGVPVLSVSIADNQLPAARALERDDLIEYFGKSSELSSESISQLIADNLSDPDKLANMANRSSEIIDGNGSARVVAAMSRISAGRPI